MNETDTNAPRLTSHELDAIAAALAPDVLAPYLAPARPFTVGTRATFGIRAEYRTQSPSGERAPQIDAAVARIAERLAMALGSARVVDFATLVPDFANAQAAMIDASTARDRVIVCADLLQRVADPTPLLEALVTALASAPLAVVSVPLRALSADVDDLGPPRNPAFAREWTFPELQAGLDAFGLEPLFGGVPPINHSAQSDAPSNLGIIVVTTRTLRSRE